MESRSSNDWTTVPTRNGLPPSGPKAQVPIFGKPRVYGVYSARITSSRKETKEEAPSLAIHDNTAFPALGGGQIKTANKTVNFKSVVKKCVEDEEKSNEELKRKEAMKAADPCGGFNGYRPFVRKSNLSTYQEDSHYYDDEDSPVLTIRRNRQQPTSEFQEVSRLKMKAVQKALAEDDADNYGDEHAPNSPTFYTAGLNYE